jgi:hypothetical protein
MQIELSEPEVRLVLAALQTVAPTGGSSPAFRLLNKIAHQTGIDSTSDKQLSLTVSLAETVLSEAEEAGEVLRIHQ